MRRFFVGDETRNTIHVRRGGTFLQPAFERLDIRRVAAGDDLDGAVIEIFAWPVMSSRCACSRAEARKKTPCTLPLTMNRAHSMRLSLRRLQLPDPWS